MSALGYIWEEKMMKKLLLMDKFHSMIAISKDYKGGFGIEEMRKVEEEKKG